jgi:hypothetical protein
MFFWIVLSSSITAGIASSGLPDAVDPLATQEVFLPRKGF